MGTDFYSYNRVTLIGQAFIVSELDTKKTQYIRLGTKEIFLFGKRKSPSPTKFYHMIRTMGSLATYCSKYIVPGDIILVEGRLRNYPSAKDQTIWKSVVWADRVIMLCPLESLKDDLKEKFKSAINKK